MNNNIKTDIGRWSAFNMDLKTRIKVIKINVVPRLLYLFQSIPQMIPKTQLKLAQQNKNEIIKQT